MATPTNAENQTISCQLILPSRSSGVANNADGVQNILATIDVNAQSAAGNLNFRRNVYCCTLAPNDTMLPNSQIGDLALLFTFDTAQSSTGPYDAKLYIKNASGWQVATFS